MLPTANRLLSLLPAWRELPSGEFVDAEGWRIEWCAVVVYDVDSGRHVLVPGWYQ